MPFVDVLKGILKNRDFIDEMSCSKIRDFIVLGNPVKYVEKRIMLIIHLMMYTVQLKREPFFSYACTCAFV